MAENIRCFCPKYPTNIRKFAAKCGYPDIRIWANPLICSKIAQYPISESIIIYPIGVANARNIPKYPLCILGYRWAWALRMYTRPLHRRARAPLVDPPAGGFFACTDPPLDVEFDAPLGRLRCGYAYRDKGPSVPLGRPGWTT
jgi:hypothetical protein